MGDINLKHRFEEVWEKTNIISLEDNPHRDWHVDYITSDIRLRDEYADGGKYYLYQLYLSEELISDMFDVVEVLPLFMRNYMSGRTSIYKLLNHYTPENLEERIKEAEEVLVKLEREREKFLKKSQI